MARRAGADVVRARAFLRACAHWDEPAILNLLRFYLVGAVCANSHFPESCTAGIMMCGSCVQKIWFRIFKFRALQFASSPTSRAGSSRAPSEGSSGPRSSTARNCERDDEPRLIGTALARTFR